MTGPLILIGVALAIAGVLCAVTVIIGPGRMGGQHWMTAEEQWMADRCPVETRDVKGVTRYEQAVLRVPEGSELRWFRYNSQYESLTVAADPLPAGRLVCVSWASPLSADTDTEDAQSAVVAVAWWPEQPYQAQYVCLSGPGCRPVLPDNAVDGVSESHQKHPTLILDTRFAAGTW